MLPFNSTAMTIHLYSISIYVHDLERAVHFYVDKLGFKVHTDMLVDEDRKWVSLYTTDQPQLQIMIIPVEEGVLFKHNQVQKMRDLIDGHFFSYGVFKCENLKATYEALKAKGVIFIMEPGEGFLGQYEAAFLDDSGNWFRLTQDKDAV
jgi:catechol 2,3-dioxygenase-like lactoylglutathione lyase family enzyme